VLSGPASRVPELDPLELLEELELLDELLPEEVLTPELDPLAELPLVPPEPASSGVLDAESPQATMTARALAAVRRMRRRERVGAEPECRGICRQVVPRLCPRLRKAQAAMPGAVAWSSCGFPRSRRLRAVLGRLLLGCGGSEAWTLSMPPPSAQRS
jgi:hypothetical protein